MDCTKLLVLAFIAGFHSASALVCQGQNRKMSYGRAWLETQRVLPSIEARGVKIKFCEREPIYVQLYETSNEPGFRYRLVWQELIQPGAIEEKSFKLARPITIKDSYRVGVYMPNSEATFLPVSKLSTMQIQLSASDHFDVFDLRSIYSFRDLLEPGQFEIDFCGAECGEDEVIKSRPSTLPPVEYQCKPDQTDLFSGVSGTLLQNGRHLATGVAKALKTYFCGDATVTIQLFRPSDDDLNAYTLVWEKDIQSQSRHGERTQISFSRDEYIYIDESYRLGIKASSSDSPMPIPFSFHQTASTVRSRSPADVSLCSTVQFDDLGYPRDFNIEFCSNPDCADSDTSRVDREAVETPCSGGSSSVENGEEGSREDTQGSNTDNDDDNDEDIDRNDEDNKDVEEDDRDVDEDDKDVDEEDRDVDEDDQDSSEEDRDVDQDDKDVDEDDKDVDGDKNVEDEDRDVDEDDQDSTEDDQESSEEDKDVEDQDDKDVDENDEDVDKEDKDVVEDEKDFGEKSKKVDEEDKNVDDEDNDVDNENDSNVDRDDTNNDREDLTTPKADRTSLPSQGDTHKTTTTPENIITNRRPTKGRQTPPRYANGPTTRPTGSDPKVDESKSKPGSATSIWHTTSIIALLVISAFFIFLQQ